MTIGTFMCKFLCEVCSHNYSLRSPDAHSIGTLTKCQTCQALFLLIVCPVAANAFAHMTHI